MGQSRSSVLLYERNGAFSEILHINPHLVGRSHPVSSEVREFDWDSSRKGASQLSRTKTIRLSTPKTTTGEILIFALTSPLNSLHFTNYVSSKIWFKRPPRGASKRVMARWSSEQVPTVSVQNCPCMEKRSLRAGGR